MKREKWSPGTDPQENLTDDLTELNAETEAEEAEYSLEDILTEFSGSFEDSSSETAEFEMNFKMLDKYGFDDIGELTEAPFASPLPVESEEHVSASVNIEQEDEEILPAEDQLADGDLPTETLQDEQRVDPEGESPMDLAEQKRKEDPAPRARRWQTKDNRHKVWEAFPDSEEETGKPVSNAAEDVDYTALFRMFAEPQANDAGNEMEETFRKNSSKAPPVKENIKTGRGKKTEETAEQEPAPQKAETEPLLAENPLDFRDILREFMLGDQHPLYDETLGVGAKTESSSLMDSGLSDLDDMLRGVINNVPESKSRRGELPEDKIETESEETEAAAKRENNSEENKTAQVSAQKPAETVSEKLKTRFGRSRPKKEYKVEEDFPLERKDDSNGDGRDSENWTSLSPNQDIYEQGGHNERSEPGRPETAEQQTEEETGEEPDEPERGLKKFLHGFGDRSKSGKKRALNEPKAFASFEDYVPSEEPSEEKPDLAAAEEGGLKKDGETASDGQINQPASEDLSGNNEDADEEILYSGDFPSFGQWIINELMTIWIRLNGIGDRESTATMEDDSEDLGREVNVANASRYYGSQVTMLRMRFQIGLVMLAILAYITLGFPVSGMLKTAKVASAMCLGLQLTVMLLCLDVVTNAAVNLGRRKFGADGLAVLACVISSLDAFSVTVGGFGNPHIPLCLFSSMALMGVLLSSLLSARGLRKSTRVPAIGKRVYCVTAEEGVRGGGDLTLLKSVRPSAGFVRRAEEAPPDEAFFSRSAFLQLFVAIVLSLLTAVVKHSVGDMLYILSAILSCAVPVTALLAFSLPFFIGSERIFSSGAAVAGWSGIHDIGCSRNLIVTDRDLFPEDTVSIETVRIFADDSAERVIGFAGTMIAASGSGLAPSFAELMEKNNCRMRQVEDFQWLSGGGLQGRIEGSTVLCGSSDLMQLMNVKVPYRLVDRTTVLLAIDGVLYGIFKINYTGLPEIRTALQELIASNRHPIFAIRDFNITPEMLHEVFDVATDGYDFPPYGDRFRISEAKPSESSKVSAVICREGLGPLTHLADTGRSMYVAIRLNLMITVLVAVLGMLLVFFKLIITGEVSAWLPFVLMLLDALVVALVSLFMRF